MTAEIVTALLRRHLSLQREGAAILSGKLQQSTLHPSYSTTPLCSHAITVPKKLGELWLSRTDRSVLYLSPLLRAAGAAQTSLQHLLVQSPQSYSGAVRVVWVRGVALLNLKPPVIPNMLLRRSDTSIDPTSEVFRVLLALHVGEVRLLKECLDSVSSCSLSDDARRHVHSVAHYYRHVLPNSFSAAALVSLISILRCKADEVFIAAVTDRAVELELTELQTAHRTLTLRNMCMCASHETPPSDLAAHTSLLLAVEPLRYPHATSGLHWYVLHARCVLSAAQGAVMLPKPVLWILRRMCRRVVMDIDQVLKGRKHPADDSAINAVLSCCAAMTICPPDFIDSSVASHLLAFVEHVELDTSGGCKDLWKVVRYVRDVCQWREQQVRDPQFGASQEASLDDAVLRVQRHLLANLRGPDRTAPLLLGCELRSTLALAADLTTSHIVKYYSLRTHLDAVASLDALIGRAVPAKKWAANVADVLQHGSAIMTQTSSVLVYEVLFRILTRLLYGGGSALFENCDQFNMASLAARLVPFLVQVPAQTWLPWVCNATVGDALFDCHRKNEAAEIVSETFRPLAAVMARCILQEMPFVSFITIAFALPPLGVASLLHLLVVEEAVAEAGDICKESAAHLTELMRRCKLHATCTVHAQIAERICSRATEGLRPSSRTDVHDGALLLSNAAVVTACRTALVASQGAAMNALLACPPPHKWRSVLSALFRGEDSRVDDSSISVSCIAKLLAGGHAGAQSRRCFTTLYAIWVSSCSPLWEVHLLRASSSRSLVAKKEQRLLVLHVAEGHLHVAIDEERHDAVVVSSPPCERSDDNGVEQRWALVDPIVQRIACADGDVKEAISVAQAVVCALTEGCHDAVPSHADVVVGALLLRSLQRSAVCTSAGMFVVETTVLSERQRLAKQLLDVTPSVSRTALVAKASEAVEMALRDCPQWDQMIARVLRHEVLVDRLVHECSSTESPSGHQVLQWYLEISEIAGVSSRSGPCWLKAPPEVHRSACRAAEQNPQQFLPTLLSSLAVWPIGSAPKDVYGTTALLCMTSNTAVPPFLGECLT